MINKTLIKELQNGNQQAQQELYSHYADTLLLTAMRYCGRRTQAEDVIHDAFIKIFSVIKNFEYRSESQLTAWLNRVVANLAIEQLRKSARLNIIPLNEAIGSDEEVDDHDDITLDIDTIPISRLLELISQLPDGYRTVFNLYCIENYSHREIAEMLSINERSSSSQLLRAKRHLANNIKIYIDKEHKSEL